MTTDELNAIVQAVMTELEKAGVDFDFKAETPQADDLVYVMRGTADRYMGITVKWQNLLDIIVQKATEAKNEAVSAKDIALQTLATIQGIESNVSSMKSSVETSEANVASMKASVETSEANVTQMKSDVSTMKASVEGTKTEVENIKEETAGLLDTKVNSSDSLSFTDIMNTADLTNKVASASALKELATLDLLWTNASPTSEFASQTIGLDLSNYNFVYIIFARTVDGYTYNYSKLSKVNHYGENNYDMAMITYTSSLGVVYRYFIVSNNGVNFGGGMCGTPFPSSSSNTAMIPYKIYGVK